MNPLEMNDNQLKQYIDTIFMKYDTQRSGTLNTFEMTKYLNQLFQLLGYTNLDITAEQAQQAMQMIDKNGDNKISKMEMFLTFKQLASSSLTDFGDVKIFMLGQTSNQGLGYGTNQNNQGWGNQAPGGGFGGNNNNNNYPYGNNSWGNNQNQNTIGNQIGAPNLNTNNINRPTINTNNDKWGNNGNSNGWNNTGNNQGYPNSNRAHLPPTPNQNQNFKGSQTNQWGPQTPQYPPQSPTWGQQQARGSGAGIQQQPQQQQQYYQQARGSGAQYQNQNQTWGQQARGSGVGIGAQYPGYSTQPTTQNTPLSNNLVWGNGNNQQLVWGVPGQRPGTPPSAAYTGYNGYQQSPQVYYDPYSGGYMKVGAVNSQDSTQQTIQTKN